MAFSRINGVKLVGISACVPKQIEDNSKLSLLGNSEDAQKFINTTGIRFRRVVDNGVCTSDLCEKAATKLISDLNWSPTDIDVLIVVTQTPDYIAPNTSIILQNKLGLSKNCIAFDIPLGCSGYVYGLFTISSILASTGLKRGLLLVGDTLSQQASPKDKSAFPLFGDAGTASAIEYTGAKEDEIKFLLGSDGSGYDSIIVPAGGYREPITCESLVFTEIEQGISRNRTNTIMIGADVFTFGISVIPKAFNEFIVNFDLSLDDIDTVYFHQANKFMNEKIRKKIGLEEIKVPYSLNDYGNTSSASIPITIVNHLEKLNLNQYPNNIAMCGFGVGLSWGICYLSTDRLHISNTIEY